MTVAACAALVERGDPARFAATMAAPVAARDRLWPLYAYNLEIARAPWASREPMIAEMRLQWWVDCVEEAGAGGRPRAHEVAGPLAALMHASALPPALLIDMAEARRWDVWSEPFADDAAFAAYIDRTAGNLMWAAATVLGAPGAAEPVVRDYAWGAGLAAWFHAVPELEARGRYPLPDGRPEAVRSLAQDGLVRIARAKARRHLLARQVAPALFPGWQAGADLRIAADHPGAVADGLPPVSEFARRRALAWRALSGRW